MYFGVLPCSRDIVDCAVLKHCYTGSMLAKPAGWILVLLQLALLLYIAWTGPLVPLHPIWLGTYVGGLTLFFWSVWAMRGNKLNITPTVPKRSKLITTGPYRLIRHP